MSKKHTCVSYIVCTFAKSLTPRKEDAFLLFQGNSASKDRFSFLVYIFDFLCLWFQYHRGNKNSLFDQTETLSTLLPKNQYTVVFIFPLQMQMWLAVATWTPRQKHWMHADVWTQPLMSTFTSRWVDSHTFGDTESIILAGGTCQNNLLSGKSERSFAGNPI